ASGAYASHVTAEPRGNFAYVANSNVNNISAFSIDWQTGALAQIAGRPFAAGINPCFIAIHPNGKFAYVPNYGGGYLAYSSVWVYAIDGKTSAVSEITGSPYTAGTDPESVTVDPTGRFAFESCGPGLPISWLRQSAGAIGVRDVGTVATTAQQLIQTYACNKHCRGSSFARINFSRQKKFE
ncbi:MAG TPA: hypothetical protein VED85_06115, partial [Burkholderiaceae bacterium]|nr:hypothetical protein [Burkholderiaceae bacterium]